MEHIKLLFTFRKVPVFKGSELANALITFEMMEWWENAPRLFKTFPIGKKLPFKVLGHGILVFD